MGSGRRQRGGLEHEVIAVLAADGGAMTPGQVRAALGAGLAYTTVMTVLARLCGKGASRASAAVGRSPTGPCSTRTRSPPDRCSACSTPATTAPPC